MLGSPLGKLANLVVCQPDAILVVNWAKLLGRIIGGHIPPSVMAKNLSRIAPMTNESAPGLIIENAKKLRHRYSFFDAKAM